MKITINNIKWKITKNEEQACKLKKQKHNPRPVFYGVVIFGYIYFDVGVK